jgi:AraC-like DNA-binding protein
MPGTEKGSVSIAFVREAVQSARRRGLEPAPLLARAGIPEALLHFDAARVDPESFGALWLAIAAALDDEFFGLDSRRMKVGSFATLCYLMVGAGTLGPALQHLCRFFNVVLDQTRTGLRHEHGEAVLALSTPSRVEPGDDGRTFAQETLLVMTHGLMCWLVGRRVPIRRATFAYPKPAWHSEYHAIFCADLVFSAPETQLVFGARHLEAAVVQTADSAQVFLRGAPANFIRKYHGMQSLTSRVRHRLRNIPPGSWPSQVQLAAELQLGASTLHRKLDQEGSSLRAIKEGLRLDLAINYLTESSMTIDAIAEAVGFAEPGAFRRAFKHWTGQQPGAFRSRQGGKTPA